MTTYVLQAVGTIIGVSDLMMMLRSGPSSARNNVL